MELHLALKKAVEQEGEDFLNNKEGLLIFLNQNNAFAKYKMSREILIDLIDKGYAKYMISAKGAWEDHERELLEQYITETGCREDLSLYILQSIAFALDWLEGSPTPIQSKPAQSNKKSKLIPISEVNMNSINSESNEKLSPQQLIEVLNSLVEIKVKTFTEVGLFASNWYIDVKGKKSLLINCQVEGSLKKNQYGYFHATFFDMLGRVRQDELIEYIDNNRFHGFLAISTEIKLNVSMFELSKICLYFD